MDHVGHSQLLLLLKEFIEIKLNYLNNKLLIVVKVDGIKVMDVKVEIWLKLLTVLNKEALLLIRTILIKLRMENAKNSKKIKKNLFLAFILFPPKMINTI